MWATAAPDIGSREEAFEIRIKNFHQHQLERVTEREMRNVEAWYSEPRRPWLSRPSFLEDLDRFRTNT